MKGLNPKETERIVRQALKEMDITHIDAVVLFLGAISFLMQVISANNLRNSLDTLHEIFPEEFRDDIKESIAAYMTGSLAIIEKINQLGRKERQNG